jgi:nifR3 family TIM-barrel protein
MRIGRVEIRNPLRLAPMADITNAAFRLVARECGSDLVTSEEIEAYSLLIGSERTQDIASYLPEEHPIALQLLGGDPEVLARAARLLEEAGADIVDLNMGCPVPKITKKGHGAALMRDPLRAAVIFRAMRKALSVPLTVKIRGGWDETSLNAVEIARVAEAEGVDALTVHPRTRCQRFTGKAPWTVIAEVVRAVRIPVTGNGDVKTQEDARRMMAETGAVSVMIGRAALGQPWVFDADFFSLSPAAQWDYKWRVIQRHRDLICQRHDGHRAAVQIKKHLAWYSRGLYDAAALRYRVMSSAGAEGAWDAFAQGFESARKLIESSSLPPVPV